MSEQRPWRNFDLEWPGGGTAGNRGRPPLELDEYEIMALAHRRRAA
jgi:hypothetical protein